MLLFNTRGLTGRQPEYYDTLMTLRSILTTLLLATLILSGCGTGDFGSVPGSQSERQAEALARNGRHADAASVYIGLASGRAGTERDRLTLLAVEQWLDAGDGQRARNALRDVAEPAPGELRWLWNTDRAAMYLHLGRPDEALEILEPMSSEALTLRHRSRAEALRADAWFQKDQPARAVQLYLQRENWLDDAREVEQNQQRLWAGLLVSNPESLRSAASSNSDAIVSGWLSLGALATSTGRQGIGWSNGVSRWRESHAGHPAVAVLEDMVIPDTGPLSMPTQVALLLPVTGSNATAGKAVQNGFFGAYFAANNGLDEAQRIVVYDVATLGVTQAYNQAVQDGAQFIVGPLLKRDVVALSRESMLSVPVLALNNLSNETIPPPGFFQFALSPEDEAVTVAERALADEAFNAVALYPNDDRGRRIMNSFASAFESRGGRLLDHTSYQAGTQDFSLEIESLMGLSQSVSRYNRLRANLDLPLQFDPRRRQDVKFVFLVADSKVGRLIKSQLKFHYAGELPVYSTSFINSMDGRSNRDLNGIMFAETPWIIAPPAWIASYPELYSEYWPAERRMGRLHAMGYDSYQLISQLFSNGNLGEQELIGATGQLYMDEGGRVHRRLAWAQFQGGEPVALPDPESLQREGGEIPPLGAPIEDNLSSQPTEWRSQQLNP